MKKTALQENVQNLVRNVRVYVIGTLFPFRSGKLRFLSKLLQPRIQGLSLPPAASQKAFFPRGVKLQCSSYCPSYLLLRLTSRKMWSRGGGSVFPSSPNVWNRGSMLGMVCWEYWGPSIALPASWSGSSFPGEEAERTLDFCLPPPLSAQLLEWAIDQRDVGHCPHSYPGPWLRDFAWEKQAL